MLLIARFGELASSVSILLNVTAVSGVASAFFETNRRPVVVAAHSVELSADVRLSQPTLPPERVVPYVQAACAGGAQVSRPLDVGLPKRIQSPHCCGGGGGYAPVNSLQKKSRNAGGPPPSLVRNTCKRPTNIEPCTAGSVIIGM